MAESHVKPEVRILLTGNLRLVREGIQALLETQPDFKVIGNTGDGYGTLRLAEQLQPEVVIIDLMLPGLSGALVIRRLRQWLPRTKVVVLASDAQDARIIEAFENGALACVLEDATAKELVYAVQQAVANRKYLSPPLSERAMAALREQTKSSGKVDLYETLSNREQEVLQLAAEGHTNSAIAFLLHISQRTVESHRFKLMHKLKLQSQSELIQFAIARGLLQLKSND